MWIKKATCVQGKDQASYKICQASPRPSPQTLIFHINTQAMCQIRHSKPTQILLNNSRVFPFPYQDWYEYNTVQSWARLHLAYEFSKKYKRRSQDQQNRGRLVPMAKQPKSPRAHSLVWDRQSKLRIGIWCCLFATLDVRLVMELLRKVITKQFCSELLWRPLGCASDVSNSGQNKTLHGLDCESHGASLYLSSANLM